MNRPAGREASPARARLAAAAVPVRDAAAVVVALTAPLSIAASQSALGVALLATLVAAVAGRPPRRTGLEIPAALLLGWAILMVPFSGDPHQSLVFLRRFYLLAAVWIFAEAAARPRVRAAVLAALAAGAAVVAAYGIWQVVARGGGRYDPQSGQLAGRATLIQGYMTGGGVLMLAGLVLLAFLTGPLGSRRRGGAAGAAARPAGWKALGGLGLAMATVAAALVLTMTRSAWLGFVAGAAVVLALRRARLLAPAAAVALAAILLLPGAYRERLASTFQPHHRDNEQRLIMWRTGLRILHDHPWTGVGDRDLKRVYRAYHQGEQVEVQGHLHNNLVQLGAIWGVPGLLLGGLLLLAPPVLLLGRWRRLRGGPTRAGPAVAAGAGAGAGPRPWAAGWTLAALAAWTGFFVAGLFEWNLGDAEVALLLWLIVGMGLAAGETAGDVATTMDTSPRKPARSAGREHPRDL